MKSIINKNKSIKLCQFLCTYRVRYKGKAGRSLACVINDARLKHRHGPELFSFVTDCRGCPTCPALCVGTPIQAEMQLENGNAS